METKVRFTVLQLAEVSGVSREAAYGLVQFLETANLALVAGSVKTEGKRGKGQYIYELNADQAGTKLNDVLAVLSERFKHTE